MTERKRHVHYQCIRALADGWGIEYYFIPGDEWIKATHPLFNVNNEYRIIPDKDGWLPWYGGEECPLPEDTIIECKYILAVSSKVRAGAKNWQTSFLYRPVDPYAELKAAAKDPTKQISVGGIWWYNCGEIQWRWDSPPECYQIRDKPQADPYAELKAKNIEGFRVRVQCLPGAWSDWITCPTFLDWIQPPEEYEFELIPKTRKVKLYQWLFKDGEYDYRLINHTSFNHVHSAWVVRRLDETMIEVEVPAQD